MIYFTEFAGGLRPIDLRLRWTDPTHQLAVYKFEGNPDSIPALGQRALRFCCSAESEVLASVNVSGYFDAIAVAFEQAAGGTPGPADSQTFEITARPTP